MVRREKDSLADSINASFQCLNVFTDSSCPSVRHDFARQDKFACEFRMIGARVLKLRV